MVRPFRCVCELSFFFLCQVLCLDLWQLLSLFHSFGHQRFYFNCLLHILPCQIDLPSLISYLIINDWGGSCDIPYMKSIAQFSISKYFFLVSK